MARQMHSRYFCTANKKHRVFPYDAIDRELGIEAPALGRSGEAVLLSTLNAHPPEGKKGEPVIKWAWCWACDSFVQCVRRTQAEVRAEYMHRSGVVVRSRRRS